MLAAGLHFGHDAGGAAVDENGLTRFLDKERRSRVKHALGLSAADIREVVGNAEILGLSSTQNMPMFLSDGVDIELEGGERVTAADSFAKLPAHHHFFKFAAWMGEDFPSRIGVRVRESVFGATSRLNEGFDRSYEALGMVAGQLPQMTDRQRRSGELRLDGRTYPAHFYEHHFLHALYAAFTASPSERAVIVTGDGGSGPGFEGGGIYFWVPGKKLLPVTPVDGWLGSFYDQVAERLGLGLSGGAGKLMGLAPYGRPLYYEAGLIGTRQQVTDGGRLTMAKVISRWMGRDPPAWDPFDDFPPEFVADIAASAQLILERNIQELVSAALRIARRTNFDVQNVVLSGGLALNCPANSNLAVNIDLPVLVPPAINDEGLAIGAAVAAYRGTFGAYPKAPATYAEAAYIGTQVTADEARQVAKRRGWASAGGIEAACEVLLRDELVGLCYGRSEVGPRALGHRSILANPASTKTWAAANRLKRREPWRPFAPAVLKDAASTYFDRGPQESRFMLFNYRCKTKELPAITHFDHSSRIQHVSPETGPLYELLLALQARGRPPVLMNTSFNGPGVPIVDTAEEAFAEAEALGLPWILTEAGLFRCLRSAF